MLKLDKGEHAKAEYLSINPKGLVPTLINNGEVVIESIDILNYLENQFGTLGTETSENIINKESIELLEKIDVAQKDVKTCSFYFLFRVRTMMSLTEFDNFKENHSNEELVRFHECFRAGLDLKEVQEAVDRTRFFFDLIEDQLEQNNGYLMNGLFSICDLALVPNVHRFSLMKWPFEKYPNILSWFQKIKRNQWFKSAIQDWEPPDMVEKFSTFVEKNKHDNISAFL